MLRAGDRTSSSTTRDRLRRWIAAVERARRRARRSPRRARPRRRRDVDRLRARDHRRVAASTRRRSPRWSIGCAEAAAERTSRPRSAWRPIVAADRDDDTDRRLSRLLHEATDGELRVARSLVTNAVKNDWPGLAEMLEARARPARGAPRPPPRRRVLRGDRRHAHASPTRRSPTTSG